MDALALIGTLRPNVALVNISMPELNGLEATERASKQFPRTRILVFSMHAKEESRERGDARTFPHDRRMIIMQSRAHDEPHAVRAPGARSLVLIVMREHPDDIRSPSRSVANLEFHRAGQEVDAVDGRAPRAGNGLHHLDTQRAARILRICSASARSLRRPFSFIRRSPARSIT